MIQLEYLRFLKPFFLISLGSRREETRCCALATYKEGGNGYAKAYRQNGVLSSPTLGRDRGDHVHTANVVRNLASALDVPVVKTRPPASCWWPSHLFSCRSSPPIRTLPRGDLASAIVHHFGSRCLGSRSGAAFSSEIVMGSVRTSFVRGRWAVESCPSKSRNAGHFKP
jgi:hypothetical protein